MPYLNKYLLLKYYNASFPSAGKMVGPVIPEAVPVGTTVIEQKQSWRSFSYFFLLATANT
jgi:hypothetical protein